MFHVKQILHRLTPEQRNHLKAFEAAVLQFNAQFNLVSRPSANDFWAHHVADCLGLAVRRFPDGAVVADWGTGGGLPAIPLAIAFPRVTFYAVDSNRKKHFALRTIQRQLGLKNLHPWHGRANSFPHRLQYSVSRATAPLTDLWAWHSRCANPQSDLTSEDWNCGLVCLKGGDLRPECDGLNRRYAGLHIETIPLADTSRNIVHVYRRALRSAR